MSYPCPYCQCYHRIDQKCVISGTSTSAPTACSPGTTSPAKGPAEKQLGVSVSERCEGCAQLMAALGDIHQACIKAYTDEYTLADEIIRIMREVHHVY